MQTRYSVLKGPRALLTLSVLALFTGLFFSPVVHARSLAPAEFCGKTQLARCRAEIESAAEGTVGQASPSSEICVGDSVSTGDRSRLRWLAHDGTEIELPPNSRARLEAPSHLQVEAGFAIIARSTGGTGPAFEASNAAGSAWIASGKTAVEATARADGSSGIKATVFRGEASLAFAEGAKLDLRERESAGPDPRQKRPIKLSKRTAREQELSLEGGDVRKQRAFREAPCP